MSNIPNMPPTPQGYESNIVELPIENSEQREAVAKLIERQVLKIILELRALFDPNDHHQRESRRENALFLIDAIKDEDPYRKFLLLEPRMGRLIGAESCYKAGMKVCAEADFTVAEAQRIYDETPEADTKELYKDFKYK